MTRNAQFAYIEIKVAYGTFPFSCKHSASAVAFSLFLKVYLTAFSMQATKWNKYLYSVTWRIASFLTFIRLMYRASHLKIWN